MADTILDLSSTAGIPHRGPWMGLDAGEYTTRDLGAEFKNRRILAPIGNRPPVARTMAYARQLQGSAAAACLTQTGLR